jgi:2,3-bisphosphoglycerate-independent phosphoglycerate mutase
VISTTILVILDGWGLSEETAHNGIALSKTPVYDGFLKRYPWTQLQASAGFVGLPEGQMGNSEVGHLNIGAGRLVKQLLPRISEAFKTSEGIHNISAIQSVKRALNSKNKRFHVICLLSDGGIHSHQSHLEAVYDAMTADGIDV